MESEADKIYKEVERRKARAKELGIMELIGELYFNNIKYYPHWIKSGPEYVCSLIKDAIESFEGEEGGILINREKTKKQKLN